MKTPQDERRCLPSASAIERLALCPGSHRLSRGLPDISTPAMAAYANTGIRIHMWLENPTFVDLTPDEREIADRCAAQRDTLVAHTFGAAATVTFLSERRLWLSSGRKKRFSGRLDFAAYCGAVGLVIDYKTGHGDTTESDSNPQLRSQAVLFRLHVPALDVIHVAIVQPPLAPRLVVYDKEALRKSHTELIGILDAAEDPKAKRVPGKKQCSFCPARAICPEAFNEVESVAALAVGVPAKSLAEHIGRMLPLSELNTMLNRWQVAKLVGKHLEALAKLVLKSSATCLADWTLGKPSKSRSVRDALALYKELRALNLLDGASFRPLLGVSVGDLEKALRDRNGLTEKQVADILETHCSNHIKTSPKEPALERKESE